MARTNPPRRSDATKVRRPDAVVLDPKDNVATSLHHLSAGSDIRINSSSQEFKMRVTGDIPAGHKLALLDIVSGQHIIKFGEIIGVATNDISKGTHVHTQNLATLHGCGSSAPHVSAEVAFASEKKVGAPFLADQPQP